MSFIHAFIPKFGLASLAHRLAAVVPESWCLRFAGQSIANAARQSGLGFEAGEWVSLALLAGVFGAAIACVPLVFILTPAAAVFCALACGSLLGLGVFSLPFVYAARAVAECERGLSSFASRLLSAYSERDCMLPALASAASFTPGRLGRLVQQSIALYTSGASAEEAFIGLRECGSRRVALLSRIIERGMESGADVGDALEGIVRDSADALEFECEREAKVGTVPFVIAASSAFFFPLFAALGIAIMGVLQGISSYSPYGPRERQLIEFSVLFYLFSGVVLDASYAGRVRFGDARKGVLFFSPLLALFAFGVFLAASKLAGSMAGIG